MTNDAPAPYYTAFIDEAGDPGLNTVRPIDAVGESEWLCLGAVVTRAKYDADVVFAPFNQKLAFAPKRTCTTAIFRRFAKG